MQIRPSVPTDLARVDALLARTYPRLLKADYPPSVLVTALPHISRAQPDLLACGTYFVAEVGPAILGAGGWTPDRSDRRKGHVRHLVVDVHWVRHGIGSALMEFSFDSARHVGVDWLECWSTYTAVPFYRSIGFQEIAPIEVPLQPGIVFPAVRMMCAL